LLVEMLDHGRVRQRMVALERQQVERRRSREVVAPACQNLLGNSGLAPHGVERHDAVLKRKLVQQFRNGGDLVRLAVDTALAQHKALLTRPRTDHVQRRLLPPVVERAPDHLAVDRDHLTLEIRCECADPRREPGLERVGIDQHEHAPERVVRGNAVWQLQKGLEPSQLAAAIQRDVVPALGARDHRAYRDDQDISQAVLDLAGTARVLDRAEILPQVLDRHASFPRHCEGASSYVSTEQARKFSCVAPGPSP